MDTALSNETQSQRLELELQEARQFSDSIIDTAHVMIIVLDHHGRVIRFNNTAEQLTGYKANEILGRVLWDVIIAKEDRARIIQNIRSLDHSDVPLQTENFILTKNGHHRLVLWSSRRILDEKGKLKWMVCTGVDITEQKALQDQIQKSDKMRAMGELAIGIAHDFNNILTGIRGHIHLLQLKLEKGAANEEDIKSSLEKVAGATKRAGELVGQILKFVREGPSRQEDVDLNGLVEDVVQILNPYIKKEDLHIKVQRHEEPTIITGDPAKLQQVVLNLVVNAIHACHEGGRISIRTGIEPCLTGLSGGCAVIEVEDTGHGIDSSIKDKIFEPYFTTKDKSKEGTGLGLFVAYSIVKAHKGKIEVWSQPGKGSRFSVYFPLTKTQYQKPADFVRATDRPKSAFTVLTVDHREALRELLTESISLLGYRVLTAGSGREALELYETHGEDINLVIMDRFLPDISCENILESLNHLNPEIKIIIMAGFLPDAEELKKMPRVADVLLKPFSIYTLKSLLARYAGKSHF